MRRVFGHLRERAAMRVGVDLGAAALLCLLLAPAGLAAEPQSVSAAFVLDTRVPRHDFDEDGMPDAYEQSAGLNWQMNDAGGDADADGRSNIEEYNAGTDPQRAEVSESSTHTSMAFLLDTGGLELASDTDSDGMPDWWEIRYGLNPDSAEDRIADDDLDGRSNLTEYLAGWNPKVDDRRLQSFAFSDLFVADTGGRFTDTDSDSLPNWWERLFFSGATSASPLTDADGDGHSNGEEFLADTDPTDKQSLFSILEVRAEPGSQAIIRWASVPTRTYSLWKATGGDFTFRSIATNLTATPPINSYTNALSGARELYRVSAAP